MARRLPSAPPTLSGFTSVRVLGSGGFADVFLFEQNMPRRQVAIKVMLPEVVNEQVRRMFQVEADLMATLSAHPSILTVYEAGVSSDGRPYLVMELCSASLGQRYRSDPLPVAEVLRIGVKIGGALHTAHQQGILHRDVKPSNILLTAYGSPVLSDFGISSSTRGSAATAEAVGLSIPWSAPEVVSEETQGTVASEVWALSATLYSLLAGRSPFEDPRGASAPGDLARRIGKARLPPIGRTDVPASLETVLARGMSKKPAERQASALELVRELQAVETELGLAQTGAEIAMAEWATGYARDRDDRTVLAPPGGASAGDPPGDAVAAGARGAARRRRSAPAATRSGGSGSHPSRVGSTGGGAHSGGPSGSHSGSAGTTSRAGDRSSRRPRTRALVIGGAVLLVGLVVAGGLVLGLRGTQTIPRVGEISAVSADGRILFSWNDPGLGDGDSYLVTTVGGRAGSSAQTSVQRSREFATQPNDDGSVCITVAVLRSGTSGPASSEKCAAAE